MNKLRLLSLGALLSAALAAGCAKGPPPNFYMLGTPPASEPAGLEQGVAIGVGPIELPKHLDRNQIVSRESAVKLQLSEGEQWAEPLKDGVTRALAVQLALTLESNRIFALPLRQRRELDFQVAVDVLRLDGALGGTVVLGARWNVLSGDGRKLLLTRVSVIEEPAQGPGIGAFVEAQSRAVAKLGQEIGEAIKSRSF